MFIVPYLVGQSSSKNYVFTRKNLGWGGEIVVYYETCVRGQRERIVAPSQTPIRSGQTLFIRSVVKKRLAREAERAKRAVFQAAKR